MKTLLTATLSLVFGVSSLTVASADPPAPQPHIIDRAGDANGINGQGLFGGAEIGQDTRPVSVASADIVAIYYETLYDTIRERDAAGNIIGVKYVQHSFRVSAETTAPVKPTAGPSVMFRIPARIGIGACEVFIDGYVRGSAPGANELERADINKLTAQCPGGSGFLTDGFAIGFEGNMTKLTFPFDKSSGMFAPGVALEPTSKVSVRTVLGQGTSPNPTTPAIDETAIPARWVIGIDVPPDVDCAETPENLDCQEP
ncbi:MAG: hypothetical protein ACRDH9_11855 [Actinomycetota bacterium]